MTSYKIHTKKISIKAIYILTINSKRELKSEKKHNSLMGIKERLKIVDSTIKHHYKIT